MKLGRDAALRWDRTQNVVVFRVGVEGVEYNVNVFLAATYGNTTVHRAST